MTPAADTHAAAQASGRKYETFRKIWPSLVRREGFPAPFTGPPYQWDPARLETWREAAAAARLAQLVAPPPEANDNHHDAPPSLPKRGRVAAGRARIMQRMTR